MQTRRTLLQAIGFGTAGAMLRSPPTQASHRVESDTPAPWWLIQPLEAGSPLGKDWNITKLGPVADGASVLTIHQKSESLNVHICLHDGKPKGIAYSELFDLIVMDRGRGVRIPPENLSTALFILADIIRQNEWADVPNTHLDGIHRMMTHPERVRSFGASHLQ